MNVGNIGNDLTAKVLSRGEGSGCEINGISVGDCSTVNVWDILNNPVVKVLPRGGESGPNCEINGISVGDCSTVNVGDVANDLKAKVVRGESETQSCKINGISVLDCSSLNVGDILNNAHAKVARGETGGNSCVINGVSVLVRFLLDLILVPVSLLFRTALLLMSLTLPTT